MLVQELEENGVTLKVGPSGMGFVELVTSHAKYISHNMGVSKNSGTLKWMVYNGKPY